MQPCWMMKVPLKGATYVTWLHDVPSKSSFHASASSLSSCMTAKKVSPRHSAPARPAVPAVKIWPSCSTTCCDA